MTIKLRGHGDMTMIKNDPMKLTRSIPCRVASSKESSFFVGDYD